MVDINIYPRKKNFQQLLQLYPPVSANKFLPEWYKKQKAIKTETHFLKEGTLQAKQCPAIQEDLLGGIIIPAWSDMYITVNQKEPGTLEWDVAVALTPSLNEDSFSWIETHPPYQVEGMKLNGVMNVGIVKLNCPYLFSTPKGYALHFTDPFYHHRRNIKLLPGSVETDIWHEANFPFEFYEDVSRIKNKKVMIKAGEPLLMVKPYKKENENINLNLNDYNQEFADKHNYNCLEYNSTSHDWKKYKDNRNK